MTFRANKKLFNAVILSAVIGLVMTSAMADINDDGAGTVGGGTGAGELFFSIFDDVKKKSLVLDLGLGVGDFLANPLAPFSKTSGALSAFIATGNIDEMEWNVVGVSNTPSPDNSHIFLLTTIDDDSVVEKFATRDSQSAAIRNTAQYLSSVNLRIVGETAEFSSAGGDDLNNGYWDAGSWSDTFGGTAPGAWNNSADYEGSAFETASMFRIGLTASGADSAVVNTPALADLVWHLDPSSGTVSLQSSAVPLPAAVWLLGSAMCGLLGWRRRS